MMSDVETTKIFFSEYITSYKCWKNIKMALEETHIPYAFLKNTKDIWARDYMPIEIAPRHYVFYNYDPDYLKDEPEHRTSDVLSCCDFNNPVFTNLPVVLDGGNIIKCGDKVIMTDKIFQENKGISKNKLTKMIEECFKAQLVIIPWDENEKYGHADGMVRYIGSGHILLNDYKDFDLPLRKRLLDALSPHFTTIDELDYGNAYRSWSWAHINFLQVGSYVFVPLVVKPSDTLAVRQIKEVFGDGYNVIGVEVKGIVRNGGALNCISLNIM